MKHYFSSAIYVVLLFTLPSWVEAKTKTPTLTYSSRVENGIEIKVATILLNKHTSPQDVINTCAALGKEGVKFTFNHLAFGRSVLGLVGRNRIRSVSGIIELPDGSYQRFSAGGITNFRSIRIQISQTPIARIEMIETID